MWNDDLPPRVDVYELPPRKHLAEQFVVFAILFMSLVAFLMLAGLELIWGWLHPC